MATVNITPDGNSVTTGWTAEGGPSYLSVDDPVGSPDDAATKVYSPTADNLFSVTLTASGLSVATISNVRGFARMYGLNTSTSTFQIYVTVGGTNYYSDTKDTAPNNTTYQDFTYDWALNPSTSAAWTIADVDALILGIKKINTSGQRCTQMYATVTYTTELTVTVNYLKIRGRRNRMDLGGISLG